MSVATLKKLSARRKNPSFGRRVDFTSRRWVCSSECDARVENRKLTVPPSGLKPHAAAIASSKVDLPHPFSPMMNVTSDEIRGREAREQQGRLPPRRDPRFRPGQTRAGGLPVAARLRPRLAGGEAPVPFHLRRARGEERAEHADRAVVEAGWRVEHEGLD